MKKQGKCMVKKAERNKHRAFFSRRVKPLLLSILLAEPVCRGSLTLIRKLYAMVKPGKGGLSLIVKSFPAYKWSKCVQINLWRKKTENNFIVPGKKLKPRGARV